MSKPYVIILSSRVIELLLIFHCLLSPSASAIYPPFVLMRGIYAMHVLYPLSHASYDSTQSNFCRRTACPRVDDIFAANQPTMPPALQRSYLLHGAESFLRS
jgi:hypothetical protein